MKDKIHLMLDLETLGDKSFSIIVSLGAVVFNIYTAEIINIFYTPIDIDSSLKFGFRPTGSTLKWWMNQNETARKKITAPGLPINEAISQFDNFYKENNVNYIWGNSAKFDIGLICDAYERVGMNIPWQFRNEMCYRTLNNLFPEIKKEFNYIPSHDPIEDCQNQIFILNKIFNKL